MNELASRTFSPSVQNIKLYN